MWHFNFSLIDFLLGLLAWVVIGLIAYRIYKKHAVRLRVWKIVFVILVGLFSFSINWIAFDTLIEISILPLGVWVLYAVLKRKEGRWQNYRLFAWLGFWSNFIFLITNLISIPIQQVVYQPDQLSTYLSDLDDVSVVAIHPSASELAIDKGKLLEQLSKFSQEEIMSYEWYEETSVYAEDNKRNEQFPYLLVDYKTEWGSGLESMIYVERDGKGVLISTADQQYYFRSEMSTLKEVDDSE